MPDPAARSYPHDSAEYLLAIDENTANTAPYAPGSAWGTRDHLLQRWHDYLKKYLNAKDRLSWETWRNKYVTAFDNNKRGLAFEAFFADQERLTQAKGWKPQQQRGKFPGMKSKSRVDLLYDEAGNCRMIELKSGPMLGDEQLSQLADLIILAANVPNVGWKNRRAVSASRRTQTSTSMTCPVLVGGPVDVAPDTVDLHLGLVHEPAVGGRVPAEPGGIGPAVA
jgi:hypothetical protein